MMQAVATHSAIKWKVRNCLRTSSFSLPLVGVGRFSDAVNLSSVSIPDQVEILEEQQTRRENERERPNEDTN